MDMNECYNYMNVKHKILVTYQDYNNNIYYKMR